MSLNEILGQSRFVRLSKDCGSVTASYTKISLQNIFSDIPLPCDVYYPVIGAEGKVVMHKLAAKGKYYDSKIRSMFAEKGFTYLYVPDDQSKAFENYLINNSKMRMMSHNVTRTEKNRLLYGNAEYVIAKAFNGCNLEEVLPQGAFFAKEAARHFSSNRVMYGELYKIFAKDYQTFTHSIQVSLLGMAFCFYLGYKENEVADFGLGALFHDIGKSEIDNSILNKPAILTKEEFEEIKKHPVIGHESLAKSNFLSQDQLCLILQHHEDFNGSGYPRGLKGFDIHAYARIARIIDTYDALTTRRSYKDAYSSEEAFQIMEEKMKDALDGELLKSFRLFLKMEERQLNDQEEIFQLPDIGSMLQVQLLHHSDRIHSKFIGMDPGRYLIAAVPNHHESHMNFSKDDLIVVRYMAGGTIYGFESKVMGVVQQPSCILFMKYPDKITSCEVRNQTRFDCTFYCEAHIKEESYSGLLTNISLGGCQYVTNRLDEEKAETIVLGDIITLNFNSIDGEFFKSVPVEVRNIRRYNNRVEIGLRFISLNDTMKNKLIHSIKTLALLGKTCS